MSKKTIFTLALQIVVIGVFVFIAAGSGTDGAAVQNYQAAAKGFAEGYECGSRGMTMIGMADSQSECISMCKRAGGSEYCYGSQCGCFCK